MTPSSRARMLHWRLRLLLPLLAGALTAGCGLAGTAASTAAGGVSEAQEAQQAKQTEDRVKQQLEDAQKAAAAQRQAGEDQGQ